MLVGFPSLRPKAHRPPSSDVKDLALADFISVPENNGTGHAKVGLDERT